jgi:hypothetical protein
MSRQIPAPGTTGAVVLTGRGGLYQPVYRKNWPTACSLNNTDINTRMARHSGTARNANCRGRTIPPWDRHYENETTSSCPVIADKPMIADKTFKSLIFLTGQRSNSSTRRALRRSLAS